MTLARRRLSRRRFPALDSGGRHVSGDATLRVGARLSIAADASGRRISGRRHDRHCRPPDCTMAHRPARPAVRGREPAGRQHQHRGSVGRTLAADGCTLYAATSTNAVNATFFDRLNFNFVRDLAMVGGVVRSPLVLEVNPAVPVNTVPALVAYAKANPGKISLASFGVGSTSHVAGELFKMMAGVNMTHVPYRGSTPLVTDLLGGQVQAAFDNLPASIEHIRAGRLRALAVSTADRAEQLPNVPRWPSSCRASKRAPGSACGAEEYAGQGDRAAQQGEQRGPGRPQDQGAAHRSWRCGVSDHTGGLHQARRGRDREMG